MITKYIKLKTGFIRLDQLLKFAGATDTGGEAKELIQDNQVKVNGETCSQRGRKIFVGDEITLDNVTYLVE